MLRPVALFATSLAALACIGIEDKGKLATGFSGGLRPDQLPVMQNLEAPFRYPASLYERKVQGNVTLRIFVDEQGAVLRDSTRVEESSGYAPLDSAAVRGAEELRFKPALKNREPMAVSILFPVYFRHPEAAALPGDTVLQSKPTTP